MVKSGSSLTLRYSAGDDVLRIFNVFIKDSLFIKKDRIQKTQSPKLQIKKKGRQI